MQLGCWRRVIGGSLPMRKHCPGTGQILGCLQPGQVCVTAAASVPVTSHCDTNYPGETANLRGTCGVTAKSCDSHSSSHTVAWIYANFQYLIDRLNASLQASTEVNLGDVVGAVTDRFHNQKSKKLPAPTTYRTWKLEAWKRLAYSDLRSSVSYVSIGGIWNWAFFGKGYLSESYVQTITRYLRRKWGEADFHCLDIMETTQEIMAHNHRSWDGQFFRLLNGWLQPRPIQNGHVETWLSA